MKAINICDKYFSAFRDLKSFKQNNRKTNGLAVLKLLSYFTGVIPLGFGVTLGIASLVGRVKIKPKSELEDTIVFSVSEVPRKKWQDIATVASDWEKLATEKYYQIPGCKEFRPRTRDEEYSDPGKEIKASQSMCGQISRQFSLEDKAIGGEPWDTVIICRSNGRIQAIALYDKSKNKLGYIATHPDNVRHPINNGCQQARGAGTQIILYLASVTLRTNSALQLRSLEESKEFYKRLQFEYNPIGVTPGDGYAGITPMRLTAEKIKQAIANGIPPFDQLVRK